jgi:hypothetical protein
METKVITVFRLSRKHGILLSAHPRQVKSFCQTKEEEGFNKMGDSQCLKYIELYLCSIHLIEALKVYTFLESFHTKPIDSI